MIHGQEAFINQQIIVEILVLEPKARKLPQSLIQLSHIDPVGLLSFILDRNTYFTCYFNCNMYHTILAYAIQLDNAVYYMYVIMKYPLGILLNILVVYY